MSWRILVLFVCLSLVSPPPALALRQENVRDNAGLEEELQLALTDSTNPLGKTAQLLAGRFTSAFRIPPAPVSPTPAAGLEGKMQIDGFLGSHVVGKDLAPALEQLRGLSGRIFYVGETAPWSLDILRIRRPDLYRRILPALKDYQYAWQGTDVEMALRKLAEVIPAERDRQLLLSQRGQSELGDNYRELFRYLAQDRPEITPRFEVPSVQSILHSLRGGTAEQLAMELLLRGRVEAGYYTQMTHRARFSERSGRTRNKDIAEGILLPIIRDELGARIFLQLGFGHYGILQELEALLAKGGLADRVEFGNIQTDEARLPFIEAVKPHLAMLLHDDQAPLPDDSALRLTLLQYPISNALLFALTQSGKLSSTQAAEQMALVVEALSEGETRQLIGELQTGSPRFIMLGANTPEKWWHINNLYIIGWLKDSGKLGRIQKFLTPYYQQLTVRNVFISLAMSSYARLEEGEGQVRGGWLEEVSGRGDGVSSVGPGEWQSLLAPGPAQFRFQTGSEAVTPASGSSPLPAQSQDPHDADRKKTPPRSERAGVEGPIAENDSGNQRRPGDRRHVRQDRSAPVALLVGQSEEDQPTSTSQVNIPPGLSQWLSVPPAAFSSDPDRIILQKNSGIDKNPIARLPRPTPGGQAGLEGGGKQLASRLSLVAGGASAANEPATRNQQPAPGFNRAAGPKEQELAQLRAYAVRALDRLFSPLVEPSAGQVLVFTHPETFNVVPLAVRWGRAVAVDYDGPQAQALEALLAQLGRRETLGPYAIGTAAARRFIQGYSEPIRIERPEEALVGLGLKPGDLPYPVQHVLGITRDYLGQFV